jgi:N-acetylglutamate synthase/N-acetylornithine aminotransferase
MIAPSIGAMVIFLATDAALSARYFNGCASAGDEK